MFFDSLSNLNSLSTVYNFLVWSLYNLLSIFFMMLLQYAQSNDDTF